MEPGAATTAGTMVEVEDALQLEENADEEVRSELPKHRRCAAHTVNLMATSDISKALFNFQLVSSSWTKNIG